MLKSLPGPEAVWRHFLSVTQIPRGSNEDETSRARSEGITKYLCSWATSHGLANRVDSGGNILIQKPAQNSESDAPVCVQCHMDMVCEKTPDREINFLTDPIDVYIDGEYVKARGTSLGADDGIGLACVLALLESSEASHPPLEVLVTRDEEKGLRGASQLEPNLLSANYLINVDSEKESSVCIGCAGSFSFTIEDEFRPVLAVPLRFTPLSCSISDCQGGHSGVDVHLGRLQPIRAFARLLSMVKYPYLIRSLRGGLARNSLPRSCELHLLVELSSLEEMKAELQSAWSVLVSEYKKLEPTMSFQFISVPCDLPQPLTLSDSQRLVNFLNCFESGVIRLSTDMADLVETSVSLTIIEVTEGHFKITGSCRSSSNSQMVWMKNRLRSMCALVNYTLSPPFSSYPGWLPDPTCRLTTIAVVESERAYGQEPLLYAIHAGLECGILQGHYPAMQCVSIGPEINFPHSPSERLKIDSVAPCYETLLGILRQLSVLLH